MNETSKIIFDALISGNTRADIIELLASEGVESPDREIDATLAMFSVISGTAEQNLAFYRAALRELYRKNIDISDLKEAHSVIRDMMKLDNAESMAKNEQLLISTKNSGIAS